MTPIVPSSTSNISFIPGITLTTKKNTCLTRYSTLRKSSKSLPCSQKCTVPLSTSVRLFPQFRSGSGLYSKPILHIVSSGGTDVAVEESASPVADEESSVLAEAAEPNPTAAIPSKRSRDNRKSEMPPLKNEELIPGTTFAGKVVSIQPFGAFVDFGAFTDGLVHVSQLMDGYVKDIGSVVSVGQEVKVRLVEANFETGRISLSMREKTDTTPPSGANDKSRPSRRSTQKSSRQKDEGKQQRSKFVKGQNLEGTVKNLTRSGAFIALPEGEEGFLPKSEEQDEGLGSIMGETSLQVGQEVSVRVLRLSGGQVTLTTKKDDDEIGSDTMLGQGVVHTASNPFALAFHKNREISAFLDERVKILENEAQKIETALEVEETASATIDIVENNLESGQISDETVLSESQISEEIVESKVDDMVKDEMQIETSTAKNENSIAPAEVAASNSEPEKTEILASSTARIDVPPALESISEGQISKEAVENIDNNTILNAEVQTQTLAAESEIPSATTVKEEEVGPVPDKTETVISSISEQSSAPSESEPTAKEGQIEKATESIENNTILKDEVQIGTLAAEIAIPSATTVEKEEVGPVPEKTDTVTIINEQISAPPENETTAKASISPALVKQLREETGAGMMDCKNALSETGGDIAKAQEYLRKKGLASADKKASRATAEGRIGSYIHDSRIGILIEVNCETDFVARGEIFKELVNDLAMQVAACPQVQYLVTDDVPEEIVNKEREMEMQKEDLSSKPEHIRSTIVDGRIKKRLDELTLLEQPYIKNDKVAVKDWVKQTIATIGENIKVKRFVRYNLGEGLEKRSQDFAAEVAAQTAAKAAAPPGKEETATVEAKDTAEKPQTTTTTISAALVKQLREETGAGMMDCKKALSETGGDLEKAQEYLRKKGLSTADKKSSRLAAEGRIGSYIHDSRIGVLIEVNCETDFVGRSEKFKELVDNLAMQVVASPQVQYVSIEDIPEGILKKEKEIEMQREDLQSKPENIRERIVEGRVSKRLGELALLEQTFIKDDSVLVKDMVKQTVAAIGENIKVRRFVRFTLGE